MGPIRLHGDESYRGLKMKFDILFWLDWIAYQSYGIFPFFIVIIIIWIVSTDAKMSARWWFWYLAMWTHSKKEKMFREKKFVEKGIKTNRMIVVYCVWKNDGFCKRIQYNFRMQTKKNWVNEKGTSNDAFHSILLNGKRKKSKIFVAFPSNLMACVCLSLYVYMRTPQIFLIPFVAWALSFQYV